MSVLTHLLDVKRREYLLRRLIDGKAGAVELTLWDVANFEEAPPNLPVPWRYINRKGEDISPPRLNVAAAAPAPRRSEVQEWARALLMDPAYQEALQRRIDDGKAPAIHARLVRILARIQERQSHAAPKKEPFTYHNEYGDFLPWDDRSDPLRERAQHMIDAKAQQEEAARARQAAPDRQAAAPEDPEEAEHLVCVYRPAFAFHEPLAPPDRSR